MVLRTIFATIQILPSKISFNELNQSHINSIAMANLGGKTPFKLANILLPDGLELQVIPANEVLLKLQLL